jgi:hypothetical protein
VDLNEFTEENKKKNMKARVSLSDGVSKIVGFITDQGWSQLVSTANNHSGLEIQSH